MIIGIPKEIKAQEYRVSLTPLAVAQLVKKGQQVYVEKGAGLGSGFSDQSYRDNAATIVNDAKWLWKNCDLILKVKEPIPKEYPLFRPGLILFTFLHLASAPDLAKALIKKQVTAIGYETVVDHLGTLPLLKPMSEIAGKLAVLVGADYLRTDMGEKGILLSSVEGARSARVSILGAGNVGGAALEVASALGAEVNILDKNPEKLKQISKKFPSEKVKALLMEEANLEKLLEGTDLLIGAVLIPGDRAPKIISRKLLTHMQKGSVVVDVSVDQGACIESIKPTTLAKPVFDYRGILHYGVTNMPSLAARTATEALVYKTFPYIEKLATQALDALESDAGFKEGLQIYDGNVKHPVLARALGL